MHEKCDEWIVDWNGKFEKIYWMKRFELRTPFEWLLHFNRISISLLGGCVFPLVVWRCPLGSLICSPRSRRRLIRNAKNEMLHVVGKLPSLECARTIYWWFGGAKCAFAKKIIVYLKIIACNRHSGATEGKNRNGKWKRIITVINNWDWRRRKKWSLKRNLNRYLHRGDVQVFDWLFVKH